MNVRIRLQGSLSFQITQNYISCLFVKMARMRRRNRNGCKKKVLKTQFSCWVQHRVRWWSNIFTHWSTYGHSGGKVWALHVDVAGISVLWWWKTYTHYNDVIMGTMVSQITSLMGVYWTVYPHTDQSSASLAFVRGIHRWPVNSPQKRPVTRKMFPFDDVIMKYLHYILGSYVLLQAAIIFFAESNQEYAEFMLWDHGLSSG